MSQPETAREDLQQQLGFEHLIADVTAKVVAAPDETFAEMVVDALGEVVRFLGGDRAGILAVDAIRNTVSVTYAWYHPSLTARVPVTLNFAAQMPWATQRVVRDRMPLVVNTLADLPEEAVQDRAAYLAQGIRSNVVAPVVMGDAVKYVITLGAIRNEIRWPVGYVPRLQLLGEIIAATIESRRVAEALRLSEARLTLAAQSAGAGLWDLDLATGRIWATPEAKTLYGFVREADVTLERMLGIVHPDDVSRLRRLVAAVSEEGGEFVEEYRVSLPGGDLRWINARGRARSNVSGRPQSVTGISLDITARKVTEAALEAANADLRRLRDQLERENTYLRQEATALKGRSRIVSQSVAIRRVLLELEKVAPTDSTVLLLGETGVGKELLAGAIHDMSPRRERTMVRVNCAAIPATLIEAELFGREKGAYTGALSKQVGRFEMASESTIFLDEIGDLPPETQVKLLRVIQERQIERLGSPRPIVVNLRIIAATNRDLAKEVRSGRFREDLFYRLNVFPIRVPSLRERLDDLPLLVDSLVDELAGRIGKRVRSVSRASLERLARYDWPGNIRELRNVIERAIILSTGPVLEIEVPDASDPDAGGPGTGQTNAKDRAAVLSILQRTGWRVRGSGGAAELLGLKPTTLEARMARMGIKRP